MITTEISNTQDIIDSREVIDRIEELRAEWAESTGDDPDTYALSGDDWSVGLGEDGAEEIVALLALAHEGEQYAEDWQYGATLIHEDYFTTYAQDLAEDIGYIQRDVSWPYTHIDWDAAADELKVDYSEIEFDGHTYFVR